MEKSIETSCDSGMDCKASGYKQEAEPVIQGGYKKVLYLAFNVYDSHV